MLLYNCTVADTLIVFLKELIEKVNFAKTGVSNSTPRSHLPVKCYEGRVKVLTVCVVLFLFTASQRKIWDMKGE